jgi:hypothetical protein
VLDAFSERRTDPPGITPSVNAGQNDCGVVVDPIPDDVRKSPKENAAAPAISFRIGTWVITNSADGFVECLAKLFAKTLFLRLVPVLDLY